MIWLPTESIYACDIEVTILFYFLLVGITILLCFFFLFPVIFNNFFVIPAVKENIKIKLPLAILAGAQITFVKEIIGIPPPVVDKAIKVLTV